MNQVSKIRSLTYQTGWFERETRSSELDRKAMVLMIGKSHQQSSPTSTSLFAIPRLLGGSTEIYVAVPPDRDSEPVRMFATFTQDLHQLADWLEQTVSTIFQFSPSLIT